MYTWEFNDPDEGLEFLLSLPDDAIGALYAFMDAMTFDPWGVAGVEPGVKNMPNLPFGPGGKGQVAVHIRDEDRLLLVTQVTWPHRRRPGSGRGPVV